MREAEWSPPWRGPVQTRTHYGAIVGPDGELQGCQVIAEDVSEERSLREQLHQAQKLEAVARLAGGVAHDFNNYLTSILGFSELLLTQNDAEEDPGGPLEQIHEAALRSAAVTRQLLAFSRTQVIQPRVLEVGPLVGALNELLQRLVGEDVELVFRLHEAGLRVRMDPAQLEQVVVNLVVNARDAMAGAGQVEVEVAPGADAEREVRVSVSDTGEGIDAEIQPQIFDPFFTTKEAGKGTGLGLATVHGIVEGASGRIELESTPGEGTTFHILLPRVYDPVEEELEAPPTALVRRKGIQVLVVDDEAGVRTLIRQVLEQVGHSVREAATGPEALDLVSREALEPALLVTDVVMPKMSGVELSQQLGERLPGLRMLFLSGYSDRQEIEEIQRSKAPFLSKPFTPVELAIAVEKALQGP